MLRYSPESTRMTSSHSVWKGATRRVGMTGVAWRGEGHTHRNLRGAVDSLTGGWEDEVRDGDRTGRGQSGSEEGTPFEAAAEAAGDGDEEEERGRLWGNLACLLPFRFSIKFNGGGGWGEVEDKRKVEERRRTWNKRRKERRGWK